jgi:hypothetical protein
MRRKSIGAERGGNVVVAAMAAAVIAMAVMTGCQVDEHKNGDSDNVKIETPFGGMQVKTNDNVVLDGIGLPVYPGAVAVKKGDHGNDGAADVNMSFGSFQLRVKAMSFRTGDSQDKVEEFYRKSLRRFGDVIACRDNRPVGAPTHTAEGLTCDNDKENHVTAGDSVSHGKLELKAGSKLHQHLAEIDPDGAGTKFGVVALDLPGKAFSDDGDK